MGIMSYLVEVVLQVKSFIRSDRRVEIKLFSICKLDRNITVVIKPNKQRRRSVTMLIVSTVRHGCKLR